jgi:hypothetical protein
MRRLRTFRGGSRKVAALPRRRNHCLSCRISKGIKERLSLIYDRYVVDLQFKKPGPISLKTHPTRPEAGNKSAGSLQNSTKIVSLR